MSGSCRRLLLAIALRSVSTARALEEPVEAALNADDECHALRVPGGQGDVACTLSALQRQVRRAGAAGSPDPPAAEGQEEERDDSAPGAAPSNRSDVVGPVPKGYSAGVPVQDLGDDELDRLQAQAEEERQERTFENDLFPPEARGGANVSSAVGAKAASLSWACAARPFTAGGGPERCFCQLAENSGCANSGCSCPQGCIGVTWSHKNTVTFKNKARAHGCSPSAVLLTSPRSYFRDTNDLKHAFGGSCMAGVLTDLMLDSWNEYQSKVASKPVWQCFHSPRIASVGYLHIQTFCAEGQFHGMPTWNPSVGYCVKMTSASQAGQKARELTQKLR